MSFKYSKFQKYAIKWLIFFSALCFINSILVIEFGFFDDDGYFLAFILPFIHLGLITISFIAYSLYKLIRGRWLGGNERYIKCNYPVIWKKLHPWGDCSRNSFTFLRFIKDRYDDGTDDRLNQIKFEYKVGSNLICWPFVLTAGIWFSNLFLIALSGWQWPD